MIYLVAVMNFLFNQSISNDACKLFDEKPQNGVLVLVLLVLVNGFVSGWFLNVLIYNSL